MTTKNSQTSERTYGQYCPIAAGLDLIGDRWTLLMLRELSMGDRRFTDLRAALVGIAPNLLTERLRSLQAIGLVTTVELPPPAARSVYRLTQEGRRVEPVLRSVARFGVRYLSGEPSETLDAERVAFSLLAPWRRRPDKKLRARLIASRLDDTDTIELRYLGACCRNDKRRGGRCGETPEKTAPDRRHGTFTDFTLERLLMLPAASYARTE